MTSSITQYSGKHVIIEDADLKAVTDVLQNRKLHGGTELVRSYEAALANYFESKGAVAINSGTSALEISLHSLGVSAGDEVIVPAIAPIMTILPILRIGAKPVFVDNEISSFSPAIDDMKKVRSKKTKAIITVPMWGYPTNDQLIADFCKKYSLPWITDAAQAHGTTYRDKQLGVAATLRCYSTHERKLISTGEGGFILSDDVQLLEEIREYIQYGTILDKGSENYGRCGFKVGANLKLSAIQAALGLVQLQRLQERLAIRAENAAYLLERLDEANEIVKPFKGDKEGKPNYYSLVLLYEAEKSKHSLAKLLAESGISSDALDYDYKPIYEFDICKKFLRDCPNAQRLTASLTTIPVHEGLTKRDLDYIVDSIQQAIKVLQVRGS